MEMYEFMQQMLSIDPQWTFRPSGKKGASEREKWSWQYSYVLEILDRAAKEGKDEETVIAEMEQDRKLKKLGLADYSRKELRHRRNGDLYKERVIGVKRKQPEEDSEPQEED